MKDVGVMKDEEIKIEEIEVSNTLGGVRYPMDLCACVSEYHRDDGEGSGLEELDRLSYTLRYISLVADVIYTQIY